MLLKFRLVKIKEYFTNGMRYVFNSTVFCPYLSLLPGVLNGYLATRLAIQGSQGKCNIATHVATLWKKITIYFDNEPTVGL